MSKDDIIQCEKDADVDIRVFVLLATLMKKQVSIAPRKQLLGHEMEFLRLVEHLTASSEPALKVSKHAVVYSPGVFAGGRFEYTVKSTEHSLGYYLEMLIPALLFSKTKTHLLLKGVTNGGAGPSVDYVLFLYRNICPRLGLSEAPSLKVKRCGSAPLGGGEVLLTCPAILQLDSIKFANPGLIKRIYGRAVGSRVAPSLLTKLIDSAKSTLTEYIDDIHIYRSLYGRAESGESSGYSLILAAESVTKSLFIFERAGETGCVVEDVGRDAAIGLLSHISMDGCIDPNGQWLVLLFMALAHGISTSTLPLLTRNAVNFLRELKRFLNISFKLEQNSHLIIATCAGIGYVNSGIKYG